MTLAIERRASFRHSTAYNQTNVQLMDRFGRRITKARLVNISHHGALILTDDVGVLNQPLEVRLENAPETGWTKAEPVRFGQPQEVGIRFNQPCSGRVLDAAINGVVNERVRATEEDTCLIEVNTAPSAPNTSAQA
jgi:hypothetical protein